tara:strand:+ start:552 stop:1430 length:879 start_codon:yes stop_codon:yes gene_type:complete
MFKGSIPAIITPFDKNKEIDFESLENHIDFLVNQGSSGLVSCGTTGESPTLNHDEHMKVTEFIIEKAKKRVPVMAGCGSNSTKESLELVKHAASVGADASLLVSPYYNKPTQSGLYEHFSSIAKAVPEIGIFLYNIPSRSVVNINLDTIKKLSEIKNIVGVKDATADLGLPVETALTCGSSFIQLSGEDATFLPFLLSGGVGCISVSANIVPKLCSDMYNLWSKGKIEEAVKINKIIFPLNKVLFAETSPMPVKFALSLMKKCENIFRLPLNGVSASTEKKIYEVLSSLELI